jgi:hypothetical protein
MTIFFIAKLTHIECYLKPSPISKKVADINKLEFYQVNSKMIFIIIIDLTQMDCFWLARW